MKKKLMIVATVIGILSLGACVDDKESASVEAVRNAKTEQLKSIAALNNAQAETEKTLAAAEAALKAAEAEAIKVNNELLRVQIEQEQVRLERDKVALEFEKEMNNIELQRRLKELENELIRLENEKIELEARKDAIAKELEIEANRLEAQLLASQAALLQAQQQLKAIEEQIDETEKGKLQTLADAYVIAVTNLNNARRTLSNYKTTLMQLENNLITDKQAAEEVIAGLVRENAEYQAQIDIYKAYDGLTYEQREEALKKLDNKLKELDLEWDKAINKTREAQNAMELYDGYSLVGGTLFELQESKYVDIANKYTYYSAYTYLYPVKNLHSTETVSIEYSYPDSERINSYSYGNRLYCSIDEKAFEIMLTDRNALLSSWEDSLKQAIENSNTFKKAMDDAYKAWQKAIEDEEPDLDTYYHAYLDAKNQYDNYQDNTVTFYKKQVDEYTADVAQIKEDLAYLLNAGNIAAYKKLVDAYNASAKAYAEADVASIIASYLWNKGQAERDALISFNTVDVDAEIEWRESSIKYNEKQIERISNFSSDEEAIDYLKEEIIAQEALVAAKEIAATQAKTAFDAAMPKAE